MGKCGERSWRGRGHAEKEQSSKECQKVPSVLQRSRNGCNNYFSKRSPSNNIEDLKIIHTLCKLYLMWRSSQYDITCGGTFLDALLSGDSSLAAVSSLALLGS